MQYINRRLAKMKYLDQVEVIIDKEEYAEQEVYKGMKAQ